MTGNQSAENWRAIFKDLKMRIERGEVGLQRALPTQTELSRHYSASRHAVRRALSALRDEQLIISWQGKGAFVQRPKLEYRINHRTRFGSNMRQSGHTVTIQLISSAQRNRVPDAVARRLSIPKRHPIFVGEILHTVDGIPTLIGRHYCNLKHFPNMVEEFRRTGNTPTAFATAGIDDYLRENTVVKTRHPTPTEALILDVSLSQPVFELQGLNVDLTGKPIEVTEAIARGDRVQLHV